MPLIYDLVDPQELQGFARTLQDELDANEFVLSQFLPNQNIDDIEYRVRTGQLVDEDAAMVRAWDTESSIGGRQGISRIMGELPPISRKFRLGEEERLRLRALERGNNRELIDAIYDDAAKATRAVTARVEMFRGEALYRAQLIINENGVTQTITFGRDGALTVAPGTLWSVTATAVPVTDEQAWITTYKTFNGNAAPAAAIISTRILNYLALNAQYRTLSSVNGITPPFLSQVGLNQIRAAYNLPPLVVNDEMVRVEGVATRVIPDDRLVYVPGPAQPLGASLFGVTAEALELVGAAQVAQDQAPGLTIVTEKTFDPVATWTKGVAVALPVLFNPNMTMTADVA